MRARTRGFDGACWPAAETAARDWGYSVRPCPSFQAGGRAEFPIAGRCARNPTRAAAPAFPQPAGPGSRAIRLSVPVSGLVPGFHSSRPCVPAELPECRRALWPSRGCPAAGFSARSTDDSVAETPVSREGEWRAWPRMRTGRGPARNPPAKRKRRRRPAGPRAECRTGHHQTVSAAVSFPRDWVVSFF